MCLMRPFLIGTVKYEFSKTKKHFFVFENSYFTAPIRYKEWPNSVDIKYAHYIPDARSRFFTGGIWGDNTGLVGKNPHIDSITLR